MPDLIMSDSVIYLIRKQILHFTSIESMLAKFLKKIHYLLDVLLGLKNLCIGQPKNSTFVKKKSFLTVSTIK